VVERGNTGQSKEANHFQEMIQDSMTVYCYFKLPMALEVINPYGRTWVGSLDLVTRTVWGLCCSWVKYASGPE
jgi:hypothetical protein